MASMIALLNVTKRYGRTIVFEQANASFEEGCVHVVTGNSGEGKTTLLRLLMGLEPPDEGEIVGMQGFRMAAVFQEDRLCLNASVMANVRMVQGKQSRHEAAMFRKRAALFLEETGLGGFESRSCKELSGGQKRRVAIARAVLAKSDVMFFDEALRGLDDSSKESVAKAIAKETAGKTVFWVTHDETEAELFAPVRRWRAASSKLLCEGLPDAALS